MQELPVSEPSLSVESMNAAERTPGYMSSMLMRVDVADIVEYLEREQLLMTVGRDLLNHVSRKQKMKQEVAQLMGKLCVKKQTNTLSEQHGHRDTNHVCNICFESDSVTNPLLTLRCNGQHHFCNGCIVTWFENRRMDYQTLICPVCREDVEIQPTHIYEPLAHPSTILLHPPPVNRLSPRETIMPRRLVYHNLYPRINYISSGVHWLDQVQNRYISPIIQRERSTPTNQLWNVETDVNLHLIMENTMMREFWSRRLHQWDICLPLRPVFNSHEKPRVKLNTSPPFRLRRNTYHTKGRR